MSGFFSAFGIDWRLLIIQIVNFAVLLGALTYFLYRPMMAMLDERRKKIAEGVQAADAAQQRLADAKTESDSIIADAAHEAEGLLSASRLRAEERGKEIVSAAQARADASLKEAAAAALEEKRRALEESRREIARAAVLAAEKILVEKA